MNEFFNLEELLAITQKQKEIITALKEQCTLLKRLHRLEMEIEIQKRRSVFRVLEAENADLRNELKAALERC